MARRFPALAMRRCARSIFTLLVLSTATLPANSQTLEREIVSLADRIGRVLSEKGKRKVAVTDFVDLQGRTTELGRFLAEQLSVELVNAPGISVVDRANIKAILAEHKLNESGLISSETAKKLGQFAGVDAILTGTATSLDESISVTVKAIATDTAEIVAASKATFGKTRELQQFLLHGVTDESSPSSGSSAQMESQVIATKDLGDLRVILRQVRKIRFRGPQGETDGVQCVLEFSNRNLRDPISVAMNCEPNALRAARARLTDSVGMQWELCSMQGLSAVCVYGHYGDPSAIAETIAQGRRIEQPRGYMPQERLWMGSLTTLPTGELTNVTMTYWIDPQYGGGNSDNVNDVQLSCELVVGQEARRPKQYRLHTMLMTGIKVGH